MILGAGKGTRLRPLTDQVPKVLVPVLGVPMLERLRAFLARAGVTAVALNTHHLAEKVRAHLVATAERTAPLPPLRLFHESTLLGTGGALVNAQAFWDAAPLLVWNGDILAEVEPRRLLAAHEDGGALATLVLQERESTSRLLVDVEGRVCGIDSPRRSEHRLVREPAGEVRALGFHGVSVLSPALRARLPGDGPFDLVLALLDVIAAGGVVRAYDAGSGFFGTTGSRAELARLEEGLRERADLQAAWSPLP